MRLTVSDARALAQHALELVPADQAEVLVASSASALTRFANNRIHQNVAENDTQVSIRAVVGKRIGVASTNRLDGDALAACCASAAEAARLAPEDSAFPGLPEPRSVPVGHRAIEETVAFGADARAHAAASIIEQSSERELDAAGTVATSTTTIAIANSLGVDAAQEESALRATVLSMGSRGGAGWASFLGADASEFSPDVLGDQAATIAQRSEDPGPLEPGRYTVLLAPEAVSDILDFLGYLGFGAKSHAEGTSFAAGKLGGRLFDESISIYDDPLSAETVGLSFDFEGQPAERVALVDSGVAAGFVTDSYYAATLGVANTGHALPAPNAYGPLPLHLTMAAGDASEDQMLASVRRGVYVTRFHYVNVEDPRRAVLTGMTRDGTFLIEDGHLTQPLKNQRFTQSALDALSAVLAVGRNRRLFGPGEGGATLVPALLLESWEFTGQTG
jgi:predicted Zn-dependent protease